MSKFAHGMIYAFSFVTALFISGMDLSEASPVSFKIVGGSDSVQGQWPWQALILIEKSHTEGFYLCGGSLIHASWVLTATYCVRDYTGVQILFGVWNISNSYENHTIRSVEQVIEHPCYDPESVLLGTNLALLKLTHPEPATNAICLPSSPIYDWEQLKQGQDIADCIATGYGRTDTGSGAKILQQVQFPFVSREICKQTYPGLISNDKICAYGLPGKDTCKGDMGGPLVCPSVNRSCGYYIAGVTIAGSSECGQAGRPGVYTATFPNVEWIKAVTQGSTSANGVTKTYSCTGPVILKSTKPRRVSWPHKASHITRK